MKKTLLKLFIFFSLLLTVISNATPLTLDNNDIKIYSNYPFDDEDLD